MFTRFSKGKNYRVGRGFLGRATGSGKGIGLGRSGDGQGQGGGNKPGSGPGGNCICPQCGHKIPHKRGQRCMDIACPKCGTKMMRE